MYSFYGRGNTLKETMALYIETFCSFINIVDIRERESDKVKNEL